MPRINGTARLDSTICPIGRIGAELRSCLPEAWRAFRRWRRATGAVAALQALDARMLKDIGIERSEIESVAWGLGRDSSRVNRTGLDVIRGSYSTTSQETQSMNTSPKILAGLTLAIAIGSVLPEQASAADYANPHMLVSAAQLNGMLSRNEVRIIDVRPQPDYEAGHIPKALNIPADAVNDPTAQVPGARLLDDKLAQLFGSRGIDKDTHVVLYDDKGGFHAARLFWMLDYFGHNKVSILNGGVQKWTADGHKLNRDQVKAKPARFTPTPRERRSASADWLLERRNDPNVVVIDVRPPALYEKGHIPWARSIPWAQNLKPDNTMKSADELLTHFAVHGVTPDKNIASHCQDGKASAHSYFTLRLLGFPRVRSYDRSWAEWGADGDLPKTVPQSKG